MPELEVTYNNFFINFLIAQKYRVGRHMLLCAVFMFVAFNLLYVCCIEFADKIDGMIVYVSIFLLLSYLSALYFHLYVLLPKLLLKNRLLLYVGAVSLLIMMMIVISFEVDRWITVYYGEQPGVYSFFYEKRIMSIEFVGNFFLYALLIAGTSLTVLFRRWMQYSKRKNELEKVNLKTELECLKDQINPEFLFNMLDEVGRLTPDNPERASMMLMKLSKLLRYQLYDGNREKVLLISEIAYIENFLSLARECYPDLNFTLVKEGRINRKLVPPLLFIPFANYYVKRLSPEIKRMDIQFLFRVEEEGVFFSCACFVPGVSLADIEDGQELADVKQRLDLLFKEAYILETMGENSLYKTNLYIKL